MYRAFIRILADLTKFIIYLLCVKLHDWNSMDKPWFILMSSAGLPPTHRWFWFSANIVPDKESAVAKI